MFFVVSVFSDFEEIKEKLRVGGVQYFFNLCDRRKNEVGNKRSQRKGLRKIKNH